MSKKDIQLLLIVFGILIGFGSWQFVYKPNQAKTEALRTENDSLKKKLNELKILEAKEDDYIDEIDKMNVECDELTNSFVSGILTEDEIMYFYNMELEYPKDVKIPAINLSEVVEIPYAAMAVENTAETAASDTASDTAAETAEVEFKPVDEGIKMYDCKTSINFRTTYNGLKDIVQYVYEIPERKAVSSLNLVASDNGYLEGSMDVNFYCMTGTQVPYFYIDIPRVRTGTENIFGVRDGAKNNVTVEDENADADAESADIDTDTEE